VKNLPAPTLLKKSVAKVNWLIIASVGKMTHVYESPDKGNTVYRRKVGETTRELHSVSKRRKNLIDEIKEDQLWGNIRRAAEDNPALQRALEQCIIIYHLSKDLQKETVD
jgi:hypothetical protein